MVTLVRIALTSPSIDPGSLPLNPILISLRPVIWREGGVLIRRHGGWRHGLPHYD